MAPSRPTMTLPSFLGTSSPPRSPHVAQPSSSVIGSYFAPASSSGPSSTTPSNPHSLASRMMGGMHFPLRPTRRDVLLCLLTLSFAYLLFSPPPSPDPIIHQHHQQPASSSSTSPSRFKLPAWSYFSPGGSGGGGGDSCPQQVVRVEEKSFTESVKPFVLSAVGDDIVGSQAGSKMWDGGEEMAEDDELQAVGTVMLGFQPGWTLMEKVYVYNGSLYVVTDERDDWPELRLMTSTGLPANNEPGNSEAREPKGNEIMFITPFEAVALWGPRVFKMEGMTFLWNDGQFLDHYYHFAAELLLGTWRTYTMLDPDINAAGETSLPPPKRMWFLHQSAEEWRDKPRFNSLLTSALFPSTAMLYPQDWADLTNSTISHQPKAFLLERALLADRSAAFRGPWTAPTSRTVANALHVGHVSRWWWEPIRRQVLRYSGVNEEIINRNFEGLGAVDPATLSNPNAIGPGVADLEPLAPAGLYKPVVTYISRQSSRRRLTPESHADLVKALEERAEKRGWELVIVEAEKMTKEEQFALAGRTTIMLGVHGNGLTHLLWLPATPRSAVIEMFFKGGFARDYQWTAQTLGIRHFAVQHDITFTAPNLPEVAYPEGFQGTSITVVGKVVADLIEDRLDGKA